MTSSSEFNSSGSFLSFFARGSHLLDMDLMEVLEGDLPSRFGGNPADYQVIEDEDNNRRPVLRLIIHPRLGSLDPDEVREALVAGIRKGSGIRQVTAELWSDARLIRVERSEPLSTNTSKLKHVIPRNKT